MPYRIATLDHFGVSYITLSSSLFPYNGQGGRANTNFSAFRGQTKAPPNPKAERGFPPNYL